MKTLMLKLLILLLYLAAIRLLWLHHAEMGFVPFLTCAGILGYCGLIIVAQLVAFFKLSWCWFRQRREVEEQNLGRAVSAALETEAS